MCGRGNNFIEASVNGGRREVDIVDKSAVATAFNPRPSSDPKHSSIASGSLLGSRHLVLAHRRIRSITQMQRKQSFKSGAATMSIVEMVACLGCPIIDFFAMQIPPKDANALSAKSAGRKHEDSNHY
jgi:hypothetical protein